MIDIGFNGLIEQVEKHYGPRSAKWATGLLVFGFLCGVMILVREAIYTPLADLLGAEDRSRRIFSFVFIVLGATFAATLAFVISGAIGHRRRLKRYEKIYDSYRIEGEEIIQRGQAAASAAIDSMDRGLRFLAISNEITRNNILKSTTLSDARKAELIENMDTTHARALEALGQARGTRDDIPE